MKVYTVVPVVLFEGRKAGLGLLREEKERSASSEVRI